MKNFFILLFFLSLVKFGISQTNLEIKGKVIDQSTKQNLAFVNIGIEGTLIGTASDINGDFSFKFPSDLSAKNLYFSAIGYQNLLIKLEKYENNKTTSLVPLSYGLDDIEISTQSKVLYKKIQDASEAINDLFLTQAYNYKLLYRNEIYIQDTLFRMRNASVLLSDSEGYRAKKSAITNRNYKFLNVERNFKVESLNDGTTLMNDLLSFDFARTNNNILDLSNLNEFDLDLVEETTIASDSVWVIAFKLSNPTLPKTGSIYANAYEGKIYIAKKNNAILKLEANIQESKQSLLGRNISTELKHAKQDIGYHVTTTYKDQNGHYRLDNIALKAVYKNSNGQIIKEDASILVTELITNNPTNLKERQYFEDMDSDPDFWISIKQ